MKLFEIDISYYMEEGCGVFAVALANLRPGGDIYVLSDKHGEEWNDSIPYEVTHAFYTVEGESYDVKGKRSIEDMARDFHLSYNDYIIRGPWNTITFQKKFMGDSDEYPLYGNQNEMYEAENIIRENPKLYGT